jgi:hypothetical protein
MVTYERGVAMNNSARANRNKLDETRQIQRWVRRYAQNRSLPVAVGLLIYVILFLAISLSSYWAGVAYRDGNTTLLAFCIGALTLALAATVYLAVPWWGGRRLQQVGNRLYAEEGQVTISSQHTKRTWIVASLGLAFGACVVVSVILGVLGYLPTGKYSQPISALYVVPFLVALYYLMRPAVGSIALLWPLLYALHAVLILADVPIVFTGRWEALNMLIPTVGYGLVTSLAGHLYSRWALHSVRTIVSQQLDRAELVQDGDQQ